MLDPAMIPLQVPVLEAPELRAQVDHHQLAVQHQLPMLLSIPDRGRAIRDLFREELAVLPFWTDVELRGKCCVSLSMYFLIFYHFSR